MRARFPVIFFIILCVQLSINLQGKTRTPIPWAHTGLFDFCPQTSGFDFRNAYWLAAFSYYAYWPPVEFNKVFSSNFGSNVGVTFPYSDDYDETHPEVKPTLGMGWKGDVNFFSSSTLLPSSPAKQTTDYTSFYPAPLPFEACVKQEKMWCFGRPLYTQISDLEKRECGENLEHAFMSFDRLQNITLLNTGNDLRPIEVKTAQRDQARIEDYVRRYEELHHINLGLDFKDRHFSERCEMYRPDEEFTPDAQAVWIENKNAVIIALRGTESKNTLDWTTDFATSFQLNHQYLPFWKRNIHKGFERSLDVMSDWLHDRIDALFSKYPKARDIPVYTTGHSMGGALAVLVMADLLERNKKASKQTQLNLKSVYTFGSPRLGNRYFANHYASLVNNTNVGLYRVVNRKDFVTKAPCFDYVHFGTHIQIDSYLDDSDSQSISVSANPDPSEHNYCAYGSAILDSIYNASEYHQHHLMGSYYSALSEARSALINGLMQNQKIENGLFFYDYPNNCSSQKIIGNGKPEYLELNYQQLPFAVEE